MPGLKSLRWVPVLLACLTAWAIGAWLWQNAHERADLMTGHLEKALVVLLVILPSIGLVGVVAERKSKDRVGKLLFSSSTGVMTVLFLVSGPLRWFYAPSTFLLWIGLVMTLKGREGEPRVPDNGA